MVTNGVSKVLVAGNGNENSSLIQKCVVFLSLKEECGTLSCCYLHE